MEQDEINNITDCNYTPNGINAQFGYNTQNLMNNCQTVPSCCKNRDEVGEQMLCQIQNLMFAITDLDEYLNTHPNDERALYLHSEYCNCLHELQENYQKIYGPLTIYCPCNKWRWLEEPWPWEGREE